MAVAHRRAFATARKAAGHTQESLAGMLHIDRSTVIRWEAGETTPVAYLWPKLAHSLGVSHERLQDLLAAPRRDEGPLSGVASVCAWIDTQTGWKAGTARGKVADRWSRLDVTTVYERSAHRTGTSREAVVRILAEYYGADALYRASFGGKNIVTTIATRPEWLNGAPTTAQYEATGDARRVSLDGTAARAAVERLAEGLVLDIRFTDAQIYRLLGIEDEAVFGPARFAEYAVTSDLLEAELADSLARNGKMPLRDRWLPDLASVFDLPGRLCAGGVATLCAFARPADARRPEPDYALVVQKRSGRVLNATGKLAVVPKGFHQPMTDPRADVAIEETVRRELEEELFARTDVDNTLGETRAADPMHPSRLSAPMRWLTEHDALRIEHTGVGINLVSGNYEFATLAVVDDPTFWTRYGGAIEANWEADGLQLHSTCNRAALAELVADESWSNEGLFALLQGVQHLSGRNRTCVRETPRSRRSPVDNELGIRTSGQSENTAAAEPELNPHGAS
ncbi:helix-turn-helix transcriptional regulator [Sciscionella sediminilitoris]|uniref:helix-turn-helix transcriptional regulator n=1 Tax=Sciscionella sediminilitoris TaxID=1445613 RepID=UPI000A744279|nr:helix-turn-helix transcriptional regulator [Sciscionella sp. SE31]